MHDRAQRFRNRRWPATLRRRLRRAACGCRQVARRRAVLPVRAAVSDPADDVSRGRRLPERGRRPSPSRTSPPCSQPSIRRPPTGSRSRSASPPLCSARLIGLAIAMAIVLGGLPTGSARRLLTFSGVASQFAGVPLAFAFLATLGRLGLVTVLLNTVFGFNIYAHGFNILSLLGADADLSLLPDPADGADHHAGLDGLKKEWGEAAAPSARRGGSTGAWWSSR